MSDFHGRIARPGTHPAGRPKRTATVAVLTVAGVLAGVAAAPGIPATGLAYTCGPHPANVGIAMRIPKTGITGTPIQPGEVSVTVSLPREAIPAEATSVAGTARLAAVVSQNDDAVVAEWAGLTVPDTPVPAEGDVVLSAAGTAGPVTVSKPGDLTFTVGDLSLTLSTSDGPVTCALNPGQDATLARVAVRRGAPPGSTPPESGAPSGGPSGAPSATSPKRGIMVGPGAAAPANPKAAVDNPPGCAVPPPETPPGGRRGCTYVTGYANVRKLNASFHVEPGLTNVGIATFIRQPPLLIADNPAALVGRQFPTFKDSSFLAFGFMPITADMDLLQAPERPEDDKDHNPDTFNIHTEGRSQVPFTFTVTAHAQFTARINKVSINGVELKVGPNCRTVTPIDAVLTGGTPGYTNILLGGPLTGIIEIPPFTGCGVTEDLDPLITGTVSGPGNFISVVQGRLCVPSPPNPPPASNCPPLIPQVPVPRP